MADCLSSTVAPHSAVSSNITVYPIINFRDVLVDGAVLMVAGLVPFLLALVGSKEKRENIPILIISRSFLIVEKGKVLPPLEDNGIDGLSSESQNSGSTGVWIGVGAGVILVLFIIIAIFYLKMYVA